MLENLIKKIDFKLKKHSLNHQKRTQLPRNAAAENKISHFCSYFDKVDKYLSPKFKFANKTWKKTILFKNKPGHLPSRD